MLLDRAFQFTCKCGPAGYKRLGTVESVAVHKSMRVHSGTTLIPLKSAVDQVESLHAFTLHGHLLQAGVISAVHASLLAGFVFGINLMWYMPEIGLLTTGDSEIYGSGLLMPLLLYSRQ